MTALPLIDERAHLRADCSRCAGLCCVAPAFAASADFAIDKPAGVACPQPAGRLPLRHPRRLRERGFPGCTVFDCFGAGQRVTQGTFGGRSWREAPELAAAQFAVLPVVRQLHEIALVPGRGRGAAGRRAAAPPRSAPRASGPSALADGTRRGAAPPSTSARHRREVGELLARVSELVRGPARPDRRGADLVGRDLRRPRPARREPARAPT